MSQQVESTLNQLFIDKFNDFENQLNGQKSLPIHNLRITALNKFKELGIPKNHEEYKYTNIEKTLTKKFTFDHILSTDNQEISNVNEHLIDTIKGNVLVFINGHFSENDSNFDSNIINIKPLHKAFTENQASIKTHFGKYIANNNDGFATLNNALYNDGVFAQIAKNVVVEQPIIIYNISNATSKEAVSFPRNLIIAEESCQGSILEFFSTDGTGNSFTNSVTEIAIAENAIIDYYKISNDIENAYHIGLTQVNQLKNSTFNAHSYSFGGGIIRNNLHIALHGENCTTNMYGLYLLAGNSHVDNHTEVDHIKPNSYSNELYKGILDEKSTGVFNGKIFVQQEAQKTNAFQSNKNILLTDDATINTKPQLEIWADDVKCSHGCTTGQMDEDALFYLRARGIDKNQAKAMLLYAFAIDVIDNIKIEPLKKHINHIIAKRFNQEEL